MYQAIDPFTRECLSRELEEREPPRQPLERQRLPHPSFVRRGAFKNPVATAPGSDPELNATFGTLPHGRVSARAVRAWRALATRSRISAVREGM